MPRSFLPFLKIATRKISGDKSGIAAVEFALILPFLLILLIGTAESVGALNHDRKVSQIASSVTDLVAQAESISTGEIADIMRAATEIMLPYSDTPLDVIIASVTFDEDGDPEVDWSRDKSGSTPWAAGSTPPIEFPEAISVPGSSLVVGQSSYSYTPMFSSLLQNIFPRATSIEFGDVYYYKPRLTGTVTLTGS
jgi:Flp pilus assembly protein TadG